MENARLTIAVPGKRLKGDLGLSQMGSQSAALKRSRRRAIRITV